MAKVELQKVIHVPREKVAELFGDYGLYNKLHAREDTSYEIAGQQNNEVVVNVKQEISGRVFNYKTKTIFRLPDRIDTETLSGVGKGTRQTIVLESVPEGTKVCYISDVKLEFGGVAGKALRMVSGKMMKKMTKEALEEAAEIDRKHLEGE